MKVVATIQHQTNTIAVQGAAARMMAPAMYWSASEGVIQAEKANLKKTQAKRAIVNGFTTQLIKRVTSSP